MGGRAPWNDLLWRTDPAFKKSFWRFLIISGKGSLGNHFSPFSLWQHRCCGCFSEVYRELC